MVICVTEWFEMFPAAAGSPPSWSLDLTLISEHTPQDSILCVSPDSSAV